MEHRTYTSYPLTVLQFAIGHAQGTAFLRDGGMAPAKASWKKQAGVATENEQAGKSKLDQPNVHTTQHEHTLWCTQQMIYKLSCDTANVIKGQVASPGPDPFLGSRCGVLVMRNRGLPLGTVLARAIDFKLQHPEHCATACNTET
jgi:hypothetical protein